MYTYLIYSGICTIGALTSATIFQLMANDQIRINIQALYQNWT